MLPCRVLTSFQQQGEQNGFYRSLLGLIPSALPFLTASTRDFAFSAINQNFVVPGSCPSIGLLDPPLIIFGLLTVDTNPNDITSDADSQVQFTIDLSTLNSSASSVVSSQQGPPNAQPSGTPPSGAPPSGPPRSVHGGPPPPTHARRDAPMDWSSMSQDVFVTYINQQNVPVPEKPHNVQVNGNIVTFEALFPGKTNEMNGLTIVALTLGDGPFATVDDVADATLFGPGLIEIN